MLDKFVGKSKIYTHWQWYRTYFHIAIIRYLVLWFALVPAIAKVMENVPEEVSISISQGQAVTLNMQLPFNWQWLWISSLFFVVAYIIYQVFCPIFIKKYSSFSDYKAHYHSPRWVAWISKDLVKDKQELPLFLDRVKTKNYIEELSHEQFLQFGVMENKLPRVEVLGKQSVLLFKSEEKLFSLRMPRLDSEGKLDSEATEEAEQELFWEVFARYSTIGMCARAAILVLLALSLICFSIVLAQNVYAGFCYFIKIF